MTVSLISAQKIKIALTHTEVMACFGDYEKLLSLTPKTKLCITFLINNIISKNPSFLKAEKINAKIKITKNKGCQIVLAVIPTHKENLYTECLFEFYSTNAMTDAMTALYNNKINHKITSYLYKIENRYCLIVNYENPREKLFLLHEFCSKISEDKRDIEYVKEHGTPLILNSAIKNCGKAFLKRLH